MRYFSLFSFLFLFSSLTIAQTKTVDNPLDAIKPSELRTEIAATITIEDLTKHMKVLASDEMEGRETGTSGNEKAAAYLSDEYERLGLLSVTKDGSYLQPIHMVSKRWEKIDVTINGEEYRHIWDFYALHKDNAGAGAFSFNDITFVGYGIEDDRLNNYKNTNVRGKAVLMYGGEPKNSNGDYIISGNKTASAWSTDVSKKISLARKKGATMVFVIAEDFKGQIAANRKFLMGPRVSLEPPKDETTEKRSTFQYMVINPEMAKNMAGGKLKKVKKYRKKNSRGKSTKGLKIESNISGHMIKKVNDRQTANVIGLLPGKDKEKRDEYIIVTAHFDHLGKRGSDIFNGADDNASGTSTVLELAEAFATAAAFDQGTDRSIVFLLVSGEEKGLLGSKFYTDYPLIPLEQTMVNVNIDMVGRLDKLHENENYVYVIGADRLSTTLHEVNEAVNDKYEKLELDYTYNAPDDPNRYYYRSDHYNFAQKNIPAIFFFNGTHDDYHRPSDTIEKINFNKMSTIGRHIFHLIWELGNRDEAIEVNVK